MQQSGCGPLCPECGGLWGQHMQNCLRKPAGLFVYERLRASGVLSFWDDPAEDIYTWEDGEDIAEGGNNE